MMESSSAQPQEADPYGAPPLPRSNGETTGTAGGQQGIPIQPQWGDSSYPVYPAGAALAASSPPALSSSAAASPYLFPGVQVEPVAVVNTHRQGEEGPNAFSREEKWNLFWGWVLTLSIWFHVVVAVFCGGTNAGTTSSLCTKYYADPNSGDMVAWPYIFEVVYLAYILYAYRTAVARYLRHKSNWQDTTEYVMKLGSVPPELYFKIQCYHYDTYFDSNRGRERRARVDTHSAHERFPYDSWRTTSELPQMPRAKVVRIRFEKRWTPANEETTRAYEQALASFLHENDRDTNKDLDTGLAIEGFVEHHMAVSEESCCVPLFLSRTAYWIFTIFGLLMPYSHWVLVISKEL